MCLLYCDDGFSVDIAEILYKANLKRFVIYLGKLIFMSTRLSKNTNGINAKIEG